MTFMPQENSRATKLYRYVQSHLQEEGDLLTYEDVCTVIEVQCPENVLPSQFLGSIIDTVNKRLHRDGDWRHLQNRTNVGYYIGSPASLRAEVLGRRSHVERQMVKSLRASEKLTRHPSASVAERRRAADVVAAQASLLTMVRREHRAIRNAWVEEEVSPVQTGE